MGVEEKRSVLFQKHDNERMVPSTGLREPESQMLSPGEVWPHGDKRGLFRKEHGCHMR